MRTQNFPNCCTTDIITGLGTSANSSANSGNGWSLQEVYNYLHNTMSRNRNGAMITAIATHQQTNFIKVARILGWREGPWAKSTAHRNTRTKLFYWLVTDGIPADAREELAKLVAKQNKA